MAKNNLTIIIPKTDINAILEPLNKEPKKILIVCVMASLFTKTSVFTKIIEKCAKDYVSDKNVMDVLTIFKPHVDSHEDGDGREMNVDRFFTYVTSVLFCSAVIKPVLKFVQDAEIYKSLSSMSDMEYITPDDALWFLANIISGRQLANENIAISFMEVLKKCIPVFNEINVLFDDVSICAPLYKDDGVSLYMIAPNEKMTNALNAFIKSVEDIG